MTHDAACRAPWRGLKRGCFQTLTVAWQWPLLDQIDDAPQLAQENVFGILLVSQASSTLTISPIPQDVDAGQFRPSVAGFDFHSVRL